MKAILPFSITVITLTSATHLLTSRSVTGDSFGSLKVSRPSTHPSRKLRLRRDLIRDEEEVPETLSTLARVESRSDQLAESEPLVSHETRPGGLSNSETGETVSPSTVGSKSSEAKDEPEMVNVRSFFNAEDRGADSGPMAVEESGDRKETESIGLRLEDSRPTLISGRNPHSDSTPEGSTRPLSVSETPKSHQGRPDELDPFYKSSLKHLEVLINHEYIGDTKLSPRTESGISALLSTLNIHEIEGNVHEFEPDLTDDSRITLAEIQDLGPDKCYRDPKLINSWKAVGLGIINKQLLTIIGEVLQVWSKDFTQTIDSWYPQFLTIRGDAALFEKAPGVSQYTQCLALKNKKMLNVAIIDTSAEQVGSAVGWYKELLGASEVEKRMDHIARVANQAAKSIRQQLVSGFNGFKNNKEIIPGFLGLYNEVVLVYPELMNRVSLSLRSVWRSDPLPTHMIEESIKVKAKELHMRQDLSNVIKLNEAWPIWNYREATHMLASQSGTERRLYEVLRPQTFYRARFARMEASTNRMAEKLVELMKILIINPEKAPLLTYIEFEWLHETMRSLTEDLRVEIYQEVEFVLSLDREKLSELITQVRRRGSYDIDHRLGQIFMRQSAVRSSDALEQLFTIEQVRTIPKFWKEAVDHIRGYMPGKRTMDFDQKYDWLQQQSQAAMVTLIVTSLKNLNAAAKLNSFSSRMAVDMHLLLEKINSMYENNLPILKLIWDETHRRLQPEVILNAQKVMQSGLRQMWTRETWMSFIGGKLGYHEGEPIFEEMHALGISLQLDKEYPTFIGHQLQTAYQRFLRVPDAVKKTTQEILEDEYSERVDLLTLLAIQDRSHRSQASHEIIRSVSEYVTSERISEWLRRGISAPSMIVVAAALGLGTKNHEVTELINVITEAKLLDRLKSFFMYMDSYQALEHEELSRFFGQSIHHVPGEFEARLSAMKEHLVSKGLIQHL